MEENKKTGPVAKKRMGRFQVSIWKRRKVVPADDGKFRPEREYDAVRACVQYSRYSRRTGEWNRQHIWCNPDELRNLAGVLDSLGDDKEGDDNE